MPERGPLDFEHESDEEREARWAKRRDPDLDQPAGSPEHPVSDIPVPPPAGASRFGWFLGVVTVLLLGVVLVNTLRTHSNGSAGLKKGSVAPPFPGPPGFISCPAYGGH